LFSNSKSLFTMTIRKYICGLFVLFATTVVDAQNSIQGFVNLDSANIGAKECTVALVRMKDSIDIKKEATNLNGHFYFDGIPDGNYFLRIAYPFYYNYISAAITLQDSTKADLSNIILHAKETRLDEATVT